jgi:glycerol kinase
MSYILSIDLGTTGTTAILIDSKTYKIISKANYEFPQHYPLPGQVEHDLNEIWNALEKSIIDCFKKVGAEGTQIDSIGITNQRETICPFRRNGEPIRKAIVWQDRRTAHFCSELKKAGHEASVKEKTGLPIDPYFSGTKINWMINNDEDVKRALDDNDCLFGTVDTYILYRLTGSDSFYTEGSNASRTLLMNIKTLEWDNDLLHLLGVDKTTLPEIKNSFDFFGKTKGLNFLPDGISINGILGDQQSALLGQAGHRNGEAKCTYGTGAFLVQNTGDDLIYSDNGLLSTIAYLNKGKAVYALEGSTYIAGAAVQFLRDNLKFIASSPQVEALASKAQDEDMRHLLFLPFFTGIGSPYWKAEAKGAILGLTRDTGIPHMARATLEGIALSINDLIEAFNQDSNKKMESLRVDGGATKNNLLLQIQSNISEVTVIRPEIIETTAYGAGLATLIGSGKIGLDDIQQFWAEDRSFSPTSSDYFSMKKEQWKTSIKKLYL